MLDLRFRRLWALYCDFYLWGTTDYLADANDEADVDGHDDFANDAASDDHDVHVANVNVNVAVAIYFVTNS